MRKLDENKLSKLHTAGELLDNMGNLEPNPVQLFMRNQSHGIMVRYCVIVGNS